MIDAEVKTYIDSRLKKEKDLNARALQFDERTGLHTQGKNLVGLTGDRAIHNVIRTNKTEQTIDSGVITYMSSDMSIYTESAAASDDLDTILPHTLAKDGDIIILRAADDGDTVVVSNGTGNIVCAGDMSLDQSQDRIALQWDTVDAEWVELWRTDAAEKKLLHPRLIQFDPFIRTGTTGTYTFVLSASLIYQTEVNSSGAQNDHMDFETYLAAGTYTFTLIHSKGSNRGIYTVYIDDDTGTPGTTSVGTIDGYNAGTTFNNVDTITSISNTIGGNKRIRIRMNTKNASSSSYYATFSEIGLRRTA